MDGGIHHERANGGPGFWLGRGQAVTPRVPRFLTRFAPNAMSGKSSFDRRYTRSMTETLHVTRNQFPRTS